MDQQDRPAAATSGDATKGHPLAGFDVFINAVLLNKRL